MKKLDFIGMSDQKSHDALSINQTTCINGIFVVLVFLSHFCQYVDVSTIPYSWPYVFFQSHLGQLIVAPFLFYSGYGIMEQIKKNGINYVNEIPHKRVIKVWLHFSLAIVLFLLVAFIRGEPYSFKQIVLSFFAWEAIGNSNWYIFAILFLYIATYLGFKCSPNRKKSIVLVFALCFLYIVVMHYYKDGSWWYDTILCYPAGMLLSCGRNKYQKWVERHKVLILIICILATGTLYILKSNLIMRELLAIAFCLDITLFCSFIKVENSVLLFLGKHTFEIYILQRIPMIIFQNRLGGYGYLLTSLIATIGIAVMFKKLEKKVDLTLKL